MNDPGLTGMQNGELRDPIVGVRGGISKLALVVGGAGFVGGATVWALHRAGYRVEILDDMSSGHEEKLPGGVVLHRGSVTEESSVRLLLTRLKPDFVLHFAGSIQVGASMYDPLKYLEGNVLGTCALLRAMQGAGIRNFIFSSSASVYAPSSESLKESSPMGPCSPYGESKLYTERILDWMGRTHGFHSISLRYFNAAGAAEGRGERHDPETHLIPNILKVARGSAPFLEVFGDDYGTPDGTCIRDFVHVADLAAAHVCALGLLRDGHRAFNVGSGHGHSVLEVLSAAEKVTGCKIPVREASRRPGDPDRLVADPSAIMRESGWIAVKSSLDEILRDAWLWEQSRGSGSRI